MRFCFENASKPNRKKTLQSLTFAHGVSHKLIAFLTIAREVSSQVSTQPVGFTDIGSEDAFVYIW